MMVVVMIFLMASVIFMLRNLQLDEDIQRASLAENQALQEMESLRERATYLAEIIAQTKEQLALTERQKQELEALSEARGDRISALEVETAELYQTQQQLNVEVAGLNQQMTAIRAQRDALTDRISSMNQTITQLNQLIDTKSEEYDSLHASFVERQDQLRRVETSLVARNRELDETRATLHELQDLESQQREQIALLEQIKAARELEIDKLTIESDRKGEQIADLTKVRHQQSVVLAARLEELESLQESYRESIVSIENLQAQLEDRSTRIRALTLASAQLQGVIEQLESVKSEQGSTIERQVETQAQLREEMSLRNAQLAELEQRLSATSDQVMQLTEHKRNLELQIGTAERELEAQQLQLSRSREQLTTTLEELEQVRLASARFNERQQQEIAEMVTQLSDRDKTIGLQQQNLETLKERYASQLAKLNRAEADFIERERELVRLQTQLSATIDRLDSLQSVLVARDTQISSLNTQLASLDDEVSTLTGSDKESKQQIIQLLSEKTDYQSQVARQQQQIESLEQEIQRISIQNEDFKRELEYSERLQADRRQQIEDMQLIVQQLSSNLQGRDEDLASVRAENERLLKTGIRGDQELAQLRQAYQQRLQELDNLQQALTSRSGEVEQLQREIVELAEEREIMLRPARSPANRYVVEVLFSKSLISGDSIYQYRLPGQESVSQVSRKELEAVLTRLKAERSEGLYTRIIFPNEQHLSFSEAWEFTQHIQSNYDYYSQ